jgi:hypothetical protein
MARGAAEAVASSKASMMIVVVVVEVYWLELGEKDTMMSVSYVSPDCEALMAF